MVQEYKYLGTTIDQKLTFKPNSILLKSFCLVLLAPGINHSVVSSADQHDNRLY